MHCDTTGGVIFVCCASDSDSVTCIIICTFHWNFENGENMQKPSWRKPGNLQTVLHYQKNKKIYTVFCLNTNFIKVVQTTVKEPSSPCRGACAIWDLSSFTRAYDSAFLLKESKMHSAHDPNLQALPEQKDILVHPALHTNFVYRIGDGTALRKNRKAGFLFDFSYRQEHVDAHGSGMKVSKWSKHCSEQAISPGVILLHFPGTQNGLDQTKAELHNAESATVTSYILLQLRNLSAL